MAQTIHIAFPFRASCRALKPCTEQSHILSFTPPFTLFNNLTASSGFRSHKQLSVPHTLPCAAGAYARFFGMKTDIFYP